MWKKIKYTLLRKESFLKINVPSLKTRWILENSYVILDLRMVFNYMLTITFQKEQLQKYKSSEKKIPLQRSN